MAERDSKPISLNVNGIDMSAFVRDLKLERALNLDATHIAGFDLRKLEPITITGYWLDANTYECGVCRTVTARSAAGDPTLKHESGIAIPLCAECLVRLTDAGVIPE